MKIKYILSLLLLALILPVVLMARDSKDLANECNDLIYQTVYNQFKGKEIKRPEVRYMLGNGKEKGWYKGEILDICKRGYCDTPSFGSIKINGETTPFLNMPTFALFFNNREVFEELLENFPNLEQLIDSAIYDGKKSNGEFLTPALSAINRGQFGLLNDLIDTYDVNLLKQGGYIHAVSGYKDLISAKVFAQDAINKWKAEGNEQRLRCAKETLKVVEDWYKRHEHESRYVDEATAYNEEVKKLAKQEIKVELTPEFTPSLDIFKLQGIEENFAQNIDAKIDALIEKIMRGFDLSDFGNQA